MPRTSISATAVAVTTNTETVVATLPGITVQAGNPVDITAQADLSAGTGTTGCFISVRRGATVAGALLVQIGSTAPLATIRGDLLWLGTDVQQVDVANQQYVVTLTQVGASANGTCNYVYVRANY